MFPRPARQSTEIEQKLPDPSLRPLQLYRWLRGTAPRPEEAIAASFRVSARAPAAGVQPLRQDNSDSGTEFARGRRRSWARLIKKVYEADPRVCPRCSGALKVISLIGDGPVIERILLHLKRWHRPERPPPRPAGRAIQYDEQIAGLDKAGQWPDAAG